MATKVRLEEPRRDPDNVAAGLAVLLETLHHDVQAGVAQLSQQVESGPVGAEGAEPAARPERIAQESHLVPQVGPAVLPAQGQAAEQAEAQNFEAAFQIGSDYCLSLQK